MNKTIHTILLLLYLFPTWLIAQNSEVQISPKGGVYADAFPVTLTCDNPGLTIRYTLNSSSPDRNSTPYSSPLRLNKGMCSKSDIYKILISPKDEFYLPDSVTKGIVIRAAAFDGQGNRVSTVVTQSYFIGALGCETHGLPVVSICADSLPLFAHDTGILVPGDLYDPQKSEKPGNYSQHGREWERAVNVEFYADGKCGFNQTAGLRTHGGIRARRAQQKGLKLYARNEYGKKSFKCKIFENSELEKYKHLVLRPFKNAATPSGVNDWIANQIAAPLNMGTTASRPVILFLNGEYWGIYFIEEKADERYLESHYGVDHNNVNIITTWGTTDCGSGEDFKSLFDWIESAKLSDTAQYNLLTKKIDIPNIIDYYIFELFSANWDWPSNNIRCWQVPNGPWHWLFYDGDCCLDNPDYDVYTMATYTGECWSSSWASTLFFRKLLENKTFWNLFLLRVNQLNNTVFSYQNTKPYLENIHQLLKDEIPVQVQRFGFPQSVTQWEESCQKIDLFLSERADRFWQQTAESFLLRNDKVLSVALASKHPLFGKKRTVTVIAEEECTAWMEVRDSKGRILQGQYVYLYPGKNGVQANLGKRSGVYVVKVGDAECRITRISWAIPILTLISAILITTLLIFHFIRRKHKKSRLISNS